VPQDVNEFAFQEPQFMGDIKGHKGVGRYTVPLDQLQGENAGAESAAIATKLSYDPNDTLVNLRRWEGTVLPGLMRRPLIWCSVTIYFSAAICNQGFEETCGQHLPKIEMAECHTMGALLTFFLAFYAMSCYSRFMSQYTHLKDIEGTMRSIAIQVRMFYLLPCLKHHHCEPALAKFRGVELLRNLGASYYLVFARLYDGEAREFDLQSAHEEGLLTSEEVDDLKNETPSMCWFRVLCWAFEMVGVMGECEGIEDGHIDKIQDSILDMRQAINAVTYEAQMPVPLPYYHIITVLCFGFVLTYSYACAFLDTSPALAWIVWIVPVFGFCGMREVAIAMADPFGDDDVDLPVDVYVHNIMKFLVHFLSQKSRPTAVNGLSFYDDVHWAEKHTQNETERHHIKDAIKHGSNQEKTMVSKEIVSKDRTLFAAGDSGTSAEGNSAVSDEELDSDID